MPLCFLLHKDQDNYIVIIIMSGVYSLNIIDILHVKKSTKLFHCTLNNSIHEKHKTDNVEKFGKYVQDYCMLK